MFFFISLGLSLGLLLLSLIFRIAGKLRLGIPLLYVLVVSFGFPGWASKNEFLPTAPRRAAGDCADKLGGDANPQTGIGGLTGR